MRRRRSLSHVRHRRVPAGSLAALAVVLAALAVLVVAGARAPTSRERATMTLPSTQAHTGSKTSPGRTTRVRIKVDYVRVPEPAPGGVIGVTGAQRTVGSSSSSTTSATVAPTTTTTTTTTTTLPVEAQSLLTTRAGAFTLGATQVSVRLGPVHVVTVVVPAGIEVTLEVVCGLDHAGNASSSAVTVEVPNGSTSCLATIAVPTSTPEPARWRLVAR